MGESPGFREIPLNLPKLRDLYSRLGEERLRKILDEFYRRMANDLMIGYFFDGKDLAEIASKQAEFLLRAMGARKTYSGKPPAQAHDQLPKILRGHFDRRLTLLEETLRDEGLSAEDIRTWVSFENTFRDSIVQEEGP